MDDCRLPAEAEGPASVLLVPDVLYAATLSAEACTDASSAIARPAFRKSLMICTIQTGWRAFTGESKHLPETAILGRVPSLRHGGSVTRLHAG